MSLKSQGTIRGQTKGNTGTIPPPFHPDNNFIQKIQDLSTYKDISLENIDLVINFDLSAISITEGHKKCCVFCLQNMGESLSIAKTHARLKQIYGKGIKKDYIQESKKVLADNGFMQGKTCNKTGGIQYLWFSPEEMAKQVQWVRQGKPDLDPKLTHKRVDKPAKLSTASQAKLPRLKRINQASRNAIKQIKIYYGFETLTLKKEWLIYSGLLLASLILVLNITPIISHAVYGSNAAYLLGSSGTWTLFYSITAAMIWMLKTHVPLLKAVGLAAASTLLSLPLYSLINNTGGLIGYQMVSTLFELGFPADNVVWLYSSLFIASTIPLGNPLFHLGQLLKQLSQPFYTATHYVPNGLDQRQLATTDFDNDNLGDIRPSSLIHLSANNQQRITRLQRILDARDLNKQGNMISVVDLIDGLRCTVYIVQTSPRFDIAKLESQVKNIERSTGTQHINIIPSIAGQAGISHIEIPKNAKSNTIFLNEVFKQPDKEFYKKPKTSIPIGQNIYGKTEYRELTQFPHIIIAGTTGSGKSVQVNSMIISLMLKNTPEALRFVMIDPKMLELSLYNQSPHLALPVITQMDEAKGVLEKLVNEMEYRYALLSQANVRNIQRYHKKLNTRKNNRLFNTIITENTLIPATKKLAKLPLIICVIDEMADLIMKFGKEVEELIARIAQKARAAGIHLILATQRPDKDIVTGLIKANIPSRIALSVDSVTNSRIILDAKGAERLLGQGDLLIKTIGDHTVRAQGYFIDEDEITKILNTLITEPIN